MNKLAIDTSNQVLGIAIMQNEQLVAEIITNIKKDHSSRLMPSIVQIMEHVGMEADELDQIIVANGPGSYTGTRIGVTTAKTLAWALNIPIYGVSSLDVVAFNGKSFKGYICPFFDARRQTVFTSLVKWENEQLKKIYDESNISMDSWLLKLSELNGKILFLSPHMTVFREKIRSTLEDQAVIINNFDHLPRPSNLFKLSEQDNDTPVHHVNPNYLRLTEAEVNWLKHQREDHHHG